jgi:hypothetical protein
MIAKPTTPQLIDAVCAELNAKVAPELGDGTTRVVLEMAMAVLQGAAIRSANETAWMREEEAAIAELASRLVAELPDASSLSDALDAYRSNRSDSLYLADVLADYERAGEVLSCAAEAAYADGDAGRIEAVQQLFADRMAHENAVIGSFQAAGRT